MLQLPCIDVYSQKDFHHQSFFKGGGRGALYLDESIWKDGGTISITFGKLGCSGCSTEAAWSYIGSQSDSKYPSMNLGFCDPPWNDFTQDGFIFKYNDFSNASRNYCSTDSNSCWNNWIPGATILHEFGHALGMMHEHQSNINKDNPLEFDVAAVYDYYRRLGMTEEDARVNVIERYECTSDICPYSGSPFDVDSIMLYALPDDWIRGENPTYPNFKYSALDKEWFKIKYPPTAKNQPKIKIEFIDGEEWQKYWVKKTVSEGLSHLVGIQFIWNLPIQTPTPKPTPAPTPKPTPAPTSTPTTTEAPWATTEAPWVPTTTEAPWTTTEAPWVPTTTCSETTTIWGDIEVGYPRPQGSLPNFEWGLTSCEQDNLSSFYQNFNLYQNFNETQ